MKLWRETRTKECGMSEGRAGEGRVEGRGVGGGEGGGWRGGGWGMVALEAKQIHLVERLAQGLGLGIGIL
jgi:hypothetical protein